MGFVIAIIVVILNVNFRRNLRVFYKLRFIRFFVQGVRIEFKVLFLVFLTVVYLFTVHMWHVEIAILFGKRVIVFLRHF
jgi:hypothetical protein